MVSQTFKEFLITSNLYQVHILLNSRSRFIITEEQEKVLYSATRNPRSLRDTSQSVGSVYSETTLRCSENAATGQEKRRKTITEK